MKNEDWRKELSSKNYIVLLLFVKLFMWMPIYIFTLIFSSIPIDFVFIIIDL